MFGLNYLTIYQAFFNFIVWGILFLLYRKGISTSLVKSSSINSRVFYFLLVLFSTFAFITGDYFHYEWLYREIISSGENIHMEPFFHWIIKIIPNNYYIWRFVVWGASCFVLYLIFKRLKCNAHFAFITFILMVMIYFCSLRNSLGYVLLYYGATIICVERRLRSYLLGLIAIFVSLFLHKTMFVYLIFVFFAFIPFKRWIYICSIILFPVLYKSTTVLASSFLSMFNGDKLSVDIGFSYLEGANFSSANLFGILYLIINRLPFILLIFYAIIKIYFKDEKVHYVMRFFLQISFLLMYTSFLFYEQSASSFLSPRFWDASIYPFVFFSSMYFYHKRHVMFVRSCYYMLLVSNIFNFIYIYYKI